MVAKQQSGDICVLLDNLSNQVNQRDSLHSAAALARLKKSRLKALFIEDEILLRAAELPLVQEISLLTAEERPISSRKIQRSLRAHARFIKKEMEEIARKEKIDCSFQTIRGERTQWILDNGSSSDILFVGARNHFHKQHCFNRSTWAKHPLKVVFTDTKASERALKTAIEIAKQTHRPLMVIVIGDGQKLEATIRNRIEKSLGNLSENIEISILPDDRKRLTIALKQNQTYRLILPNDMDWIQEPADVKSLLQQIRCPIIFVR